MASRLTVVLTVVLGMSLMYGAPIFAQGDPFPGEEPVAEDYEGMGTPMDDYPLPMDGESAVPMDGEEFIPEEDPSLMGEDNPFPNPDEDTSPDKL